MSDKSRAALISKARSRAHSMLAKEYAAEFDALLRIEYDALGIKVARRPSAELKRRAKLAEARALLESEGFEVRG